MPSPSSVLSGIVHAALSAAAQGPGPADRVLLDPDVLAATGMHPEAVCALAVPRPDLALRLLDSISAPHERQVAEQVDLYAVAVVDRLGESSRLRTRRALAARTRSAPPTAPVGPDLVRRRAAAWEALGGELPVPTRSDDPRLLETLTAAMALRGLLRVATPFFGTSFKIAGSALMCLPLDDALPDSRELTALIARYAADGAVARWLAMHPTDAALRPVLVGLAQRPARSTARRAPARNTWVRALVARCSPSPPGPVWDDSESLALVAPLDGDLFAAALRSPACPSELLDAARDAALVLHAQAACHPNASPDLIASALDRVLADAPSATAPRGATWLVTARLDDEQRRRLVSLHPAAVWRAAADAGPETLAAFVAVPGLLDEALSTRLRTDNQASASAITFGRTLAQMAFALPSLTDQLAGALHPDDVAAGPLLVRAGELALAQLPDEASATMFAALLPSADVPVVELAQTAARLAATDPRD